MTIRGILRAIKEILMPKREKSYRDKYISGTLTREDVEDYYCYYNDSAIQMIWENYKAGKFRD